MKARSTDYFYRISAVADTQKTLESFFPTHLNLFPTHLNLWSHFLPYTFKPFPYINITYVGKKNKRFFNKYLVVSKFLRTFANG